MKFWYVFQAKAACRILVAIGLLAAGLVTAGAQPAKTDQAGGAQNSGVASSDTTLSAEILARRLKELADGGQAGDPATAELKRLYQKALDSLGDAQKFEENAKSFTDALESAPRQTQEIRQKLAAADAADKKGSVKEQSTSPDSKLKPDELEQRWSQVKGQIAALETQRTELTTTLDGTNQRLTEVRARIAAVKQELDEMDTAPVQGPVSGEQPELTQARGWEHQAHRLALRNELQMLQQEVASQDVRNELLQARRDQAAYEQGRLEAKRQAMEATINNLRLENAERAREEVQQTRESLRDQHPLVQKLAEENAKIASEMAELAGMRETVAATLARGRQGVEKIESELRGARLRFEVVGLSTALGRYLQESRPQAKELAKVDQALIKWTKISATQSLRELDQEKELDELRDLDPWLNDRTRDLPSEEAAAIRDSLTELARQRITLLTQSLQNSESFLSLVSELKTVIDEIKSVARRYDAFVAEHLLWLRTAPIIDRNSLENAQEAAAWLISQTHLRQAGSLLLGMLSSNLGLIFALAATLLLVFFGPATRRALVKTAEPLKRVRVDSFSYTLRALGWTALLALPMTLSLVTCGWCLSWGPGATLYTNAVGLGMMEAAMVLFSLRFCSELCRPNGVADRHFRWPKAILLRVRRATRWAAWLLTPVCFVAATMFHHPEPLMAMDLSRVILTVLLGGLGLLAWALLRAWRHTVEEQEDEDKLGWMRKICRLALPFMWLVLAALEVISLLGYVYTSEIFTRALVEMLWLVLVLIIAQQSIMRWLRVTRRRLALQAALERRAARQAENATPSVEGEMKSESLQADEPEPDLGALDSQTRKLINTSVFILALFGLWLIWSDVLPALNLLDQQVLWQYPGTLDASGKPVTMTVADLLATSMIIFFAVIAARHLPALLEIVLLHYGRVSAGARYALIKLVRYLIVVAAVMTLFSALGLSWSQMQWLVAAMGVGLGFGLQEIIANFVSGIILLLERPVRVGDIVTVGDTSGVVTKIDIRATTIRNWDRQELLVPNKEFITGRLLNWSLSDPITRIAIVVGVAYGSDVDKALALMRGAAEEQPHVLSDPAPLLSFEGFGDNALTLILRAYVESIEYRLATTTELHKIINQRFAQAGIEISFPQRDLHLDTRQPLRIRIERSQDDDMAGESG
ncbi:MAG: mechanosensitive ion channel [Gammaproteobacteria bacterium]|nr:mechanosensitive ion channel [Gammaproteobacteria bacterium]